MKKSKSGTVAVVDDEQLVLDVITSILKKYGYEVFTYKDPQKALKFLEKNSIDVALVDIRMPVMNGIELLENIKKIDPDIPVILMTAYAEIESAIEAVRKGAFDLLVKPFEVEHLIAVIEKAMKYAQLLSLEKNYKKELEETVRLRTRELEKALKLVIGDEQGVDTKTNSDR